MRKRANNNKSRKNTPIYFYGDRVIREDENESEIEMCSDLDLNYSLDNKINSNGMNFKLKPRNKTFKIEYISTYQKRKATFTKRKKGLMKKSKELSILTGASVLCIVISERNEVAMYASEKMAVIGEECKRLLQQHFMTIFNYGN